MFRWCISIIEGMYVLLEHKYWTRRCRVLHISRLVEAYNLKVIVCLCLGALFLQLIKMPEKFLGPQVWSVQAEVVLRMYHHLWAPRRKSTLYPKLCTYSPRLIQRRVLLLNRKTNTIVHKVTIKCTGEYTICIMHSRNPIARGFLYIEV